jgi:hypothetical protein
MTDNQLIDILATQLEAASANAGWNYGVVQKDEPTVQGTPTDPTIFFEKLFDVPYGWAHTEDVPNVEAMTFAETDTQAYETHFQVSALVIQNPSDLTIPTASDVCNYMKQYLAARSIVAALFALGVGVLKVSEVRNPFAVDDRNMFEANPSFDIVLTHSRSITITIPGTKTIVGTISNAAPKHQGTFPVLP